MTLRRLRRHPRFRYLSGLYVEYLETAEGRVRRVLASPLGGGEPVGYSADHYVLAAGTLNTSRIVLETHYRATGQVVDLPGLMDNRQIMMPFLSLGMLGKPVSTRSYQFHQIALGISHGPGEEFVHGQITALKAASVHPIIQSMPVDTRSAIAIFQSTHASLGVANVWLHDRARSENRLTLRPDGSGRMALGIRYRPAPDDRRQITRTLAAMRHALWKLGAVVPPGMTRVLAHGSSIHYAGTLPMTPDARPFTTSPEGRSRDMVNLSIADGAAFPFLPAKNLTYTLMANAVRIASALAS
jgi:choline dehydrogenase-like flavoprotein